MRACYLPSPSARLTPFERGDLFAAAVFIRGTTLASDSRAPRVAALISQRAKRRVLALSISVVAGLLLGEVVVRMLFEAPIPERLPILEVQANEFRGWSMVPEDHYTYQHPVAMNSLGLRGPELGPKSAGTKRILCLGDSLTYGQGVADDETIPAGLEAELNELSAGDSSVRWETVNAGHRAYATHQELGLLRELGPTIQPDVVVVFWYWNDIKEHDIAKMFAQYSTVGPVTFDTRARVEGIAWWRWQARQLLRRSALLMRVHDAVQSPYMGTEPTAAEIDAAMLRQDEYYDRFVELGAERGFRVVVAMIPDANALGLTEHFTKTINSRLRAIAEAHGVPVIDMEDVVRQLSLETGRLPIVPYDGHYDAGACRAMGALVARTVLETEPR
jgi:lysophospholipase L1-like esterase